MNFLARLTLLAKVYLLVAIGMILLVGSSTYSLVQMSSIGAETAAIVHRNLPMTELIATINRHQLELEVHYGQATRYGILRENDSKAAEHYTHAISEFRKLQQLLVQEIEEGIAKLDGFLASAVTAEAVEEFEQLKNGLAKANTAQLNFQRQALDSLKLLDGSDVAGAERMIEKAEKTAGQVAATLDGLLADIRSFSAGAAQAVEDHEWQAFSTLLVIVVVAVIACLVISLLLGRDLKASLTLAKQAISTIASGDFRQPIQPSRSDEIGEMMVLLEGMRVELGKTIQTIRQSSNTLVATSEQLAAASEETNGNVMQEKQETDMLATAITEMAAAVQEVAGNTVHAAEAAKKAEDEAVHGKAVVHRTIESINLLAQEIADSSTVIGRLGEESDKIGMVLEVIRGIAEQTNLLALNAAIEAARAGEQGRGFAVVADEVRTLAQRTHESTQEIQGMIERVQAGGAESVRMMEQSRNRMNESVEQAAEAGTVLESVLAAVTRITDMNAQIASAAEEQSAVTNDVNRNITMIRDLSDHTASNSQHVAEASTELSQTAMDLNESIKQLKA